MTILNRTHYLTFAADSDGMVELVPGEVADDRDLDEPALPDGADAEKDAGL